MTAPIAAVPAQKFSGLAWTTLILGIVGLVGSPIIIFNNLTAIAAGVGVVLGIIALFGTRKILAGSGLALCIAAIVVTVVVQQAAVEEFDRQLSTLDQSLSEAPTWSPESGRSSSVREPTAAEPVVPNPPDYPTPTMPEYTAPTMPDYTAPTTEPYSAEPLPTPESTTHTVVYEVVSDVGASNVTYIADGNGSMGQETSVGIHWSKTIEMESSYGFFYTAVSGQNAGSGAITCRITVDGEVVKEISSQGQYAIASCSH